MRRVIVIYEKNLHTVSFHSVFAYDISGHYT